MISRVLDVVPAYPVEAGTKSKVVGVTGCTGYLAQNIVQRLLELGHVVHGTARDPAKAAALQALPGAADRLKLFKADLLNVGSFDDAFVGCEYVVHCASPYINSVPAEEALDKLIKPAVQGTENVLASVNKTPSIKRVVLTSSVAAVYGSPIERGVGHVFTEEDWSITPTETVLPYYYSKRQAERKAWEIAGQQSRWDLVAIAPPMIYGPPVSARADSESVDILVSMASGRMYPACPRIGVGAVDVRDVAAAHCLALFTPSAKGRYITCAFSGEIADAVRILAELYPTKVRAPWITPPRLLLQWIYPLVGISRDFAMHFVGLPGPVFSSAKAEKELGLKFLPLKTAIKDQAERMIEFGLLPKLQ